MIKFSEKTKNPIINSVFLCMLLFLPALQGYIYKVLTLIFPFIINVITVDMIVAFIWAVVVFLTCRVWVKRINWVTLTSFFAIFLFAVVMYFVSQTNPDSEYTSKRFFNLCFTVIPMFLIGTFVDLDKTTNTVLRYGAMFTIVVSIIYLFYKNTQQQMHIDNMDFAYKILPAVIILLSSLFEKHNRRDTIINWVVAVISVAFLVMQGTRGPILCLGIYVFLRLYRTLKLKHFMIILASIVALVVVVLFTPLGKAIIQLLIDLFNLIGVSTRVLDKMLDGSISSSNGRNIIKDTLLGILNQDPFSIRNFFADIEYTKGINIDGSISIEGTYAHNVFLELVFDFGYLLGGVLSCLVVLAILKVVLKTKKEYAPIAYTFVCIGFVHLLLSGSFLYSKYFFALMGLAINKNFYKNEDVLDESDRDKLRVAEINFTERGSTGNIMLNVAKTARENGILVKTYSTNTFDIKYKKLPPAPEGHKYYSSYFENGLHYTLTYFFGRNGSYSHIGTWLLLRDIKKIKPNVIHLHNLHKYCINLPMLFNFIKKNDVKVVWTLHDCWAFTGHCPHFDMINCEKWKEGCFDCSSYLDYPKSKKDTSVWQYTHKKEWFTGVSNMTLVTPSKWLASKVKKSFLKDYPVKVINNGIDLNVFKPTESDLREVYNLNGKKVLLFVADSWSDKKGYGDVIELAGKLDDTYKIVMVGVTDEQIKELPNNVIGILRTNSAVELAKWYTLADVFVNTTYEDTFPTVNIEALACGTPVITYTTGGSVEIIDNTCGLVVEKGNVESLYDCVIKVVTTKPFTKQDCLKRASSYNMNDKFNEYVKLYKDLSTR